MNFIFNLNPPQMRKIYNFFFSMVMLLTAGQLSAQDFTVINTGSNMTVFMTQGFASEASVAEIGIFFTNDAGELQCAGAPLSMPSAGEPFQITLWGSEAGLDNGMAEGEAFTWLANDADGNALDVSASFLPNGNQGAYSLNETAFVASLDISSSAPVDLLGCTDLDADNFNPDANLDDGSCALFGCTITTACNFDENATAFDGSCYYCYMDDCNTYPTVFYDCEGNCFDQDEDDVCDSEEIIGCLDPEACNYNQNATEAGMCEYPETYYDCYGMCINDNDTDGVCNEVDNCPLVYNPDQEDLNNDGIGDICDGIGIGEDNVFKWQIYPNPLQDYAIISFAEESQKNVSIKIINLSGKLIYNANSIKSGHKIKNTFAPGCYIVQLESENNIIRESLIVQ